MPTASGTQATSPSITRVNSPAPPGLSSIPAGTPWSIALLSVGGYPITSQNISFLQGWFVQEHGHELGTLYADNPFFSSAGAGGSASHFHAGLFPSVPGHPGLADYPSVSLGVLATAETINQYPAISAALKSGNPQAYAASPNGGNLQNDLLRWSGNGYSSVAPGPSNPYGPNLETMVPAGIAATPGSGGFLNMIGNQISSPVTGAAGGIGSALGGAYNAVTGPIKTTEGFIQKLTNPSFWIRVVEIIGGMLLVGMGLYLIAKDMGLPKPSNLGPLNIVTNQADDLDSQFEIGQQQAIRSQARRAGRRSVADASRATESESSAAAFADQARRNRIRREADQIDGEIPF